MQTTFTANAPPAPRAATAAALDRPGRNSLGVVAVAAVTALALVFFMISSVTGAAWTDTTSNDGNTWATGAVSLTDDRQPSSTMFTVANMMPGDVVTNSITVTNQSTVALDVKLYGDEFTATNDLGAHLNLKVGTTDGGGEVYDGTLAGFATAHTGYGDGTAVISLGTDVGVDDSQTYYFWVELDSGAPNTVQNSNAQIDFVWEGHTQ